MLSDPYEAYVWAYFTGDRGDSEKISLAVSNGNDALSWHALNGGKPLFASTSGTHGLRDPFIMRSHEGDRFFIIATDLKVAALKDGFGDAQRIGSRYLEIWESTDLVHWGDQRHVLVSPPEAGNSWAPEAYWDDNIGAYAVYWSSNLYDGAAANDLTLRDQLTYGRMMIATTKDFRTFSEPQVWMDVRRGNGHDGRGLIDATVARDGDWWYRFVKDERTMTVREERSHDLLGKVRGLLPGEMFSSFDSLSALDDGDPAGDGKADDGASDGGWELVRENVGVGLPNGEKAEDGSPKLFTHGEGPCIFPANPDDVNGYRWFLFIDQPSYHDGPNHYIGFATQDLGDPDGWVPVSGKLREGLPVGPDGGKPRHGTVMPITAAERDRLIAAFG
ncbi:glycoside hydrolase family 43 protein [Bifidobacterium sp. 82T10]|uniref:Glycoside hydrolase family 43 protein n=1 Tax=Bifidobacterium miconis TaxID=2834435 RepID=A0ABS6WHN1_9BIFI|nr:glycoside hydrolase family 43 protein [Bifidobacterium miconis]MBW3092767.1 glycoside hydrolase family 43 protein [Bifidobacterium miconis]